MRYRDGGLPLRHPISPCPLYRLNDGRFLLLFHNNEGTIGKFSQFKIKWEYNQLNLIRNPTYIAVGHYMEEAEQPIWFDDPIKLLDTDDIPVFQDLAGATDQLAGLAD